MAYNIIFTVDSEVIIQDELTKKILPYIYKDLEEFMLFTVLNNNELIINDNFFKIKEDWQKEYEKVWEIDDEKACGLSEEYIVKYNCKEIPMCQIKKFIKIQDQKRDKVHEFLFRQALNAGPSFNFAKSFREQFGQ